MNHEILFIYYNQKPFYGSYYVGMNCKNVFVSYSVGELEDVNKIAQVTGCLMLYIAKGIAIGCFVYGMCLFKGHGMDRDEEEAIRWLKRVCRS